MAVAVSFSEIGESEFIDKLMVVVHRDLKDTLDHLYSADDLPDLAFMGRGKPSQFVYPLLVLALERMDSGETESGEWLAQVLIAGAGLAVEDTTIAGAQRKCEKYVRAFKAVIRSGALEVLPEPEDFMEYQIAISHQYFETATKGEQVVQAVEFKIRIEYGEK